MCETLRADALNEWTDKLDPYVSQCEHVERIIFSGLARNENAFRFRSWLQMDYAG